MKKEILLELLRQARELTDTLANAAKELDSETIEDLMTAAKFAFYAATSHIEEAYKED